MKHSEAVKREQVGMTAAQIRANKCQRSKERNLLRKEERRKEAEERNTYWRSISSKEQLNQLDRRLGNAVGATKQRTKILGKQDNMELAS